MPATFAHPAAAAPLSRLGLPLSALVIGSIAPDLEYYIRLAPYGRYGHTLGGVVTFCLPLGLAVLLVFHWVAKRPLLALLPDSHQDRLAPAAESFRFLSVRGLVGAPVGIVVGAFTHLAWDSFTHLRGWGVQQFPILASRVVPTPWGLAPFHRALQHGCGPLGMGLLAIFYIRWLRRAPVGHVDPQLRLRTSTRLALWLGMLAVAGGLALFRVSPLIPNLADPASLRLFAVLASITGTAALLALLTLYSAGWHVARAAGRIQRV
ncbi:DUF4184 family protein [bacterium]|nr:DUF4184 family protein [bacterium]